MLNILVALGRSLYFFCLMGAWFIPLFTVSRITKSGQEKSRKVPLAFMMLMTIVWPDSQVKLVRRSDKR